jgi:Bacterial trigger factor protein (TF)
MPSQELRATHHFSQSTGTHLLKTEKIMKLFRCSAALILSSQFQLSTAFIFKSGYVVPTWTSSSQPTAVFSPTCLFSSELVPEPEGGDVLTAVKTMEGSKLKNMGENPGVTNENGTVYKFWLTAKVEGSLVKEIHGEVLKQSAKKANFPGFRKGQVVRFNTEGLI